MLTLLRCWHGRENSDLEVVAVNDSGGVKQASHLLKYDSILGQFDADVKITGDTTMSVDGKEIEGPKGAECLTCAFGTRRRRKRRHRQKQ